MSSNQFPTSGAPQHLILAQLQQLRDSDSNWYGSKMFIGGSYFGGEDVLELSNNASRLYQNHNALYAGKMFPSLVAIEKEVVSALELPTPKRQLRLPRPTQLHRSPKIENGTL